MSNEKAKEVKKVRCVCRACGEVFEVDEYKPSETKCPWCSITSEVRLEGQETANKVVYVKREEKEYFECGFCNIRWQVVYGKACPNCNREGVLVKNIDENNNKEVINGNDKNRDRKD